MKKGAKVAAFLSLGVVALWVGGCGTKKMTTTEVPREPEANETVQVEKAEAAPLEKYTVKSGDTLWAISDQSRNYSDSFQWPLIFKTNRDVIQDPDQISPGQVLLIQRGQTADQTKRTRQLASDTPKFTHHDEPRKTLPVDYF